MSRRGYSSYIKLAKAYLSSLAEALSGVLANGKFHPPRRNQGKVFGIGWAKTGTTTLAKCLRILGYNHLSQRLDLVDGLKHGEMERILSIVQGYESFDDWPWILLFKELDSAFPGSKFILTRRDQQRWIASYRNMLSSQGEASAHMNEVRRILYGLPFPNVTDEQLLRRYSDHNAEVMAYFADRQNSLLVVDWECGDGWAELCSFLNKAVPDVQFPHENRGIYQPSDTVLVSETMKG